MKKINNEHYELVTDDKRLIIIANLIIDILDKLGSKKVSND